MKKILFIASVLVFGASMFGAPKKNAVKISLDDTPIGWASYTGTTDLAGETVTPPDATRGTVGGFGGQEITVTNRAELLDAVKIEGKKIIYIQGLIDMTDTGDGSLIPSTVTGSTPGLDQFIAERTAGTVIPCQNYKEWKVKYTGSFKASDDQYGPVGEVQAKLNADWGERIILRINNDTTIIGLDQNSGIRGGSWQIIDVNNVIVRNLSIGDCYNPFPLIESDDGLNADYDCITIRSSKYVWIDHCRLYSTYSVEDLNTDKYETSDHEKTKWQVYDGLCDITRTCDFVTVSWCKIMNHEKTMLIGNSDKFTADVNHQTITLHHNWFDSCVQRLPMVRFATLHIFNCVYTNMKRYAIDRRQDCRIISENNYFETEINSLTANVKGSFFDKGSINVKKAGMSATPSWNPASYYKYKLDPSKTVLKTVQAQAGNTGTFVK